MDDSEERERGLGSAIALTVLRVTVLCLALMASSGSGLVLGLGVPPVADLPNVGEVTVSLGTSDFELSPGASRVVTVTIGNEGAFAVKGVSLKLVADPGLAVVSIGGLPTGADVDIGDLAPNQSVVLLVTLERAANAPSTLSLNAVVSYRAESETGTWETSVVSTLAIPAIDVSPTVTAAWTPQSVELEAGESRNIVLTVQNLGASTTAIRSLRTGEASGFSITALGKHPPTLAAGDTVSLEYLVKRSTESNVVSSSLSAVIDFEAQPGPLNGTALATLDLELRSPPPAPAAKLSVTATLPNAELIQYQSTDALFEVRNISPYQQQIERVEISGPSFLQLALVPTISFDAENESMRPGVVVASVEILLEPGDSTVVHIRIGSDEPIQPGKTLLAATVNSVEVRNKQASTTVGSVVLELSVFGESAVLAVLAIPALLLMPGLVFGIVFWLLWKYAWPKRGSATALGENNRLLFWVLALLPSLFFPFLYPHVTRFFGQERDYTRAYGLDDILYLWLMAASLAVVFWLLIGFSAGVWQFRKRMTTPQPGDSALTVIRKIASRLSDRSLARTAYVREGQTLVSLGQLSESGVLVTPTAVVGQLIALDDAARAKIRSRITKGQIWRLLWQLWRSRNSGIVVAWDSSRSSSGGSTMIEPAPVTSGELVLQPNKVNLVEAP